MFELPSIHRFALVVATLLMVAQGPDSSAAFQNAGKVQLEAEVLDWAVQPESGRVFCTVRDGDSILEVDRRGSIIRKFPVDTNATDLLIKQNHLMVACTKNPSVQVFSLDDNTLKGTVKLGDKPPICLFCSAIPNSLVYVVCKGPSKRYLAQVEITECKIRNSATADWEQRSATHVAMSPNGKWIVPDARGRTSPSGADLMRVDEDKFEFKQVRDYHDSFGPMFAGPHGRFWAFGHQLYSLDIRKKLREFRNAKKNETVIDIHPQLDLVAVLTGENLHLQKLSDASVIATESVEDVKPSGSKSSSRSRSRYSNPLREFFPKLDPAVKFDLKNNLVFVGLRKTGHWISLDKYAAKLQPIQLIRAGQSVQAQVGKVSKIPLTIVNAATAPTTVQLESKTNAAKIEGGNLVFQPTPFDVGTNPVSINLISGPNGKIIDSMTINLVASMPSVKFDFQPISMSVSKSGRFAVVWGAKTSPNRPSMQANMEMALVDLEAQKIITQNSFGQGLRGAAVDDQYVFYLPRSGNVIMRTDHKLENKKRQFVQFEPNRIEASADIVQVASRQSPTQFHKFAKDTLKQLDTTDRKTEGMGMHMSMADQVNFSYRWIPRLNQYRPFTNSGFPSSMSGNRHTEARWGRMLIGNRLTNTSGNRIYQWSGSNVHGIISKEWPMVIMVEVKQDRTTRKTTKTLEFRNLIDGEKETSIVISEASHDRYGRSMSSFYNNFGQTKILEQKNRILYLDGNSLLQVDIPVEVAKKMVIPPHLDKEQVTEIELADKGTRSVPIKTIGDTDGAKFELGFEDNNLNIDPKTGQVTANLDALKKNLLQSIRMFRPDKSETFQIRDSNSGSSIEMSRKRNAEAYRMITGKELPKDKFAARLEFDIRLTSADGQTDQQHMNVFVLFPSVEIDKKITAQLAEMKRNRQEQEKRRIESMRQAQERRKALEKQREAERQAQNEAMKSSGDLMKRIESLENENRRMRATLDAVLLRLEKISKQLEEKK